MTDRIGINLNKLLKFVKDDEYNQEETSYIERILNYVLLKLDDEGLDKMERFVRTVRLTNRFDYSTISTKLYYDKKYTNII